MKVPDTHGALPILSVVGMDIHTTPTCHPIRLQLPTTHMEDTRLLPMVLDMACTLGIRLHLLIT